MRKAGVIWFDNERSRYRVAIGKGQKHHIGRYKTLKEAEAALEAAVKGYRYGWDKAIGSWGEE